MSDEKQVPVQQEIEYPGNLQGKRSKFLMDMQPDTRGASLGDPNGGLNLNPEPAIGLQPAGLPEHHTGLRPPAAEEDK